MLGSDEQRAWYGPDHVALAIDRGAVGTLLISDELFRASDPLLRKKNVSLVEDVRRKGGEVLIFSSMHESGQRQCCVSPLDAIGMTELTWIDRTQPDNRDCCHLDISFRHRGC
jgi:protein pelota